jgi:hypothetical protein
MNDADFGVRLGREEGEDLVVHRAFVLAARAMPRRPEAGEGRRPPLTTKSTLRSGRRWLMKCGTFGTEL